MVNIHFNKLTVNFKNDYFLLNKSNRNFSQSKKRCLVANEEVSNFKKKQKKTNQ